MWADVECGHKGIGFGCCRTERCSQDHEFQADSGRYREFGGFADMLKRRLRDNGAGAHVPNTHDASRTEAEIYSSPCRVHINDVWGEMMITNITVFSRLLGVRNQYSVE